MEQDVDRFFNKNYESAPLIDKGNYRGYLNLSSNESHHKGYLSLFSEFIRQYDSSVVSKYPVFRSANTLACKFHAVNQHELMLTPGSDHAINLILFTMGANAKGLITHTPNYAGYFNYSSVLGIPTHAVEKINAEVLTQYENSLVMITNPEGFLGSVMPFHEIVCIAEVCKERGHVLVIDEAYVEFSTFDHLALLAMFGNVVIIRSYSKGMGAASMRLGAVLSSVKIISYLRRFSCENTISDFSLEYLSFLMARKNYVKEINEDICRVRDTMIARLRSNFPDWVIYESHANFITIRVRSKEEAEGISLFFLEKNIRIRLLTEKEVSQPCIRITVPSVEKVDVLLDMMKACLNDNVL